MSQTSIQWTDRTWNPVRGCSRVSEGCRNCYAERVAARFSDGPQGDGVNSSEDVYLTPAQSFYGFAKRTSDGPRWTGRVELLPEKLAEPLSWRKPVRETCPSCDGAGSENDWKGCPPCHGKGYTERGLRVFVNSMSDLFHEKLTDHEIARVFATMASASRHTFQVLTKRPERALNFFMRMSLVEAPVFLYKATGGAWPLLNVWLGVSVEDQKTADERIPLLLRTPAAVRFVSYEPALGPVDFTEWLHDSDCEGSAKPTERLADWECTCCDPREEGLDWVIVGGESGPGARPFDLAWARSVVTQCKAAGVACFVKQLGARPVKTLEKSEGWSPDGEPIVEPYYACLDRKGGDPAMWPEDLRVREFPASTR